MRVARFEATEALVNYQNYIREGRFGCFGFDCIPERLYHAVPSPHTDFGIHWAYLPDYSKHFFAFPSEEKLIEWVIELQDHQWDTSIFVSVYEVEPALKSNSQVVFHKDTAKFLYEVPLAALLS